MVIEACKEILRDVTPLTFDCGVTCNHKCCKPLDSELSGMLLFPGEETLYDDCSDFEITKTESGMLLVCHGHCDRKSRPLSCMIFPLLPLVRNGEIKLAMDERAKFVCPLADHGLKAVTQEFKDAVRKVGQLLLTDDECRKFL